MHFWHATEGPLLYAHRGASRECPENTLPAFERALELGADVLELDVHATRDGVFVVSHDATAARVAGVARSITPHQILAPRCLSTNAPSTKPPATSSARLSIWASGGSGNW